MPSSLRLSLASVVSRSTTVTHKRLQGLLNAHAPLPEDRDLREGMLALMRRSCKSTGQTRLLRLLADTEQPEPEQEAERLAAPIRARYTPEQAEDEARKIEAENRRIEALQAAQDWQAAFWSALRELERVLGVDVDGSQDLGEATVESLLRKGGR